MRRSARLGAVAHPISPDAVTFASLPLPLACRVFLALPPDARGRASCVCRAWRNALADPALWTRLDMSFRVAPDWETEDDRNRFFAALHGAAGRALGQLAELNLSQHGVPREALLQVLTAYASSLRELHLHKIDKAHYGLPSDCEAVMAAAPLLQVLTAEATYCSWQDAPRMIRGEPPFAPLRMRDLAVRFDRTFGEVGGMDRFGPFATAVADATLQPALSRLSLLHADTAQPAVMGALVEAALARRLSELSLYLCTPPAAAPLARLLAEGSLAVLMLISKPLAARPPLFDAASAALVAGAVRVNKALRRLVLYDAGLCLDMRVISAILGALVQHPSLHELAIIAEETADEDCAAFGAALAALIAADAPTLRVLKCSHSSLRDAGLAPIVEALALIRHLRVLNVGYNGMNEAFAREQLLPAVRANTTLRTLKCASYNAEPPAAVEAEEMVRRRAQHD